MILLIFMLFLTVFTAVPVRVNFPVPLAFEIETNNITVDVCLELSGTLQEPRNYTIEVDPTQSTADREFH